MHAKTFYGSNTEFSPSLVVPSLHELATLLERTLFNGAVTCRELREETES